MTHFMEKCLWIIQFALKCNSENVYHDSIQFVCPDCTHEWTGNETIEIDEEQLVVKDANGNLLVDGDDVILVKI